METFRLVLPLTIEPSFKSKAGFDNVYSLQSSNRAYRRLRQLRLEEGPVARVLLPAYRRCALLRSAIVSQAFNAAFHAREWRSGWDLADYGIHIDRLGKASAPTTRVNVRGRLEIRRQ